MADIVKYDNGNPNKITLYLKSVNTPDYEGMPNTLINPDLSLVQGVEQKYWKHVGGSVVEMTVSEKNDVDSLESSSITTNMRNVAKGLFNGQQYNGQALRSLVNVIISELNTLRKRDRDRAVDVANANNLSDLKSSWASHPTLNDRTLAQAKSSILSGIDNGDVDE